MAVSTTSPEVEFFVQAGDASGNWGTSNNKASDFLATKPAPSSGPISIAVSGTGGRLVHGRHHGRVTDTASPLVTKSLERHAVSAYTGPVAVTGDGIHVLDVVDEAGNTARAVVPIDTAAPTASATVSPPPADSAGGWSPARSTSRSAGSTAAAPG